MCYQMCQVDNGMLFAGRWSRLARGQDALHHRAMRQFAIISLAVLALSTVPVTAQVTATFEAQSDRSFGNPHDIVLSPDGSRLYVADVNNNAVKVLDPQSLATIGAFGSGELSRPHDVAFDPAGRLLVADTGNGRIAIYQVSAESGRLVDEITGLASPEGVVAAPRRDDLSNQCRTSQCRGMARRKADCAYRWARVRRERIHSTPRHRHRPRRPHLRFRPGQRPYSDTR